jgi:hypothetical protein
MGYRGSYENYKDEKARKPMRWWHDGIIDDLLVHPLDTMDVRAKRLGYSSEYLSIILNTDMFKAAYEKRRVDFNSTMAQAISNKASEVAIKGLDVLLETLETKRGSIPFAVISETVDKTLNRLGYGVKPGGTPIVNVNANGPVAIGVTVSAEQLAEARQALRAAEQQKALEAPAAPVTISPILDLTPEPGES